MSMVVDIHKKNGKREHFDVYIGRKIQYHKEFKKDSKWRNRSKNLEEYEQWVRQNLWSDLSELKGKTLGCWCVNTTQLKPVKCHGQILMKLVLEEELETELKKKLYLTAIQQDDAGKLYEMMVLIIYDLDIECTKAVIKNLKELGRLSENE